MYQPDTEKLYHRTIENATRELARLVYEVAKAHDVPYVTVTAYYHDDGDIFGLANAQLRSGKYTGIETHMPDDAALTEAVTDD